MFVVFSQYKIEYQDAETSYSAMLCEGFELKNFLGIGCGEQAIYI